MTQPDGYMPDTATNIGSFADYANTTQADWETQIMGPTQSPFESILGGLFSGLSGGMPQPMAIMKVLMEGILGRIVDFTDPDSFIGSMVDALQHIPFLNVLGYGGPANIGDTAQSTWDQLISGFVGAIGTGSGLADLFNIGNIVSSQSAKGAMSWDILGIRGNQGLFTGFAPTSTSNLSMGNLAFNKVSGTPTAPTVPVTQSTALTSWHRVNQAMDLGMVGWTGSGVTSITDFRINIWGMNTTTGDITVLHHSTNQAGLLSGTMQDNTYAVSPAVPVEAGDVIGIELHPIGAGTHSVVGDQTWRNFSSNVVPRRWSSQRNGGTSTTAPSPIADASIDYGTTLIPFVEYGVTAATSVPLPHAPELRQFSTAGATSTAIPSWCNTIEIIALGGGGGGQGCGLLWGEGGHAGNWNTIQLTRGVDIPTATTSLDIVVGAGGAGHDGILGDVGSPGTASSVSATGMTTLTATGGAGGSAGNADIPGKSPGNVTVNGVIYVGGVEAATSFSNGPAPGSGGAGSNITFINAGTGAPGSVWIRFIQ